MIGDKKKIDFERLNLKEFKISREKSEIVVDLKS
jgi:hypothetical protein